MPKKKLSQKELELLAFRRSANASPREAVSENVNLREYGHLAPGGRSVVSPEGDATQRIPQNEGIKRAMKTGQAVRAIGKHNVAGQERSKGQDVRRSKARQNPAEDRRRKPKTSDGVTIY